MNNTVYAFEAPAPDDDAQPAQTPLWYVGNKALGAPLPYNYFPMEWGILGHNIEPWIGITATPVIDRQRGTVYVTAKSGSGGFLGLGRHASYRLFAIDLWTGNIKNSVNFPEVLLPRAPKTSRICIANSNVPNMVGQISTVLAGASLNIAELLNKSRGEYAYTLIDTDGAVDAGIIDKVRAIGGVLAARVI